MKKISEYAVMLGVAGMTACSSPTQQNESIDAQVDALYNKMTKEERVAQLCGIYMTQFFDGDNRLMPDKCKELIPNGVGHCSQFMLNTQLPPEKVRDMVAQIQDWLINNTPSGIPALMHEEVLSGINAMEANVYPQQIGLACSFNPDLAEKKTYQTATDLRKVGGFLSLSPMIDVVRDPSFNRLEESYGEDAYLSAVMASAFVRGLQHGDLKQGVAACTKHFLGYGGGGNANKKELMEEILLPHEVCIRKEGSKVVMTGYHAVDGTKCVANRQIQQEILRDYLHYDGIMVSDYGSIDQVDDNMTPLQRTAAALNAGNDVDFPQGDNYKLIPEAIEKGLVSEQTFETAVKRVLKFKFMVGTLGNNVKLYDQGSITFDTPEERNTAYQLATQSVVMLKNNGVLPLNKPQKIALTGPNANSMWAMLGDYTYQSMRFFWKGTIEDGQHPKIVGLKDGMTNRLPKGYSLDYQRGCDWTEEVETVVEQSGDPRVAYLKEIQNRMIDSGEESNEKAALEIAKKSDVIIAAVGENAILCGENRDRKTLKLPGRQEEFVKKLIATGKPVVLVMFGGRAQVISEIADKCAAIIQAWYPGEEGGNALADIIYGNVSPSGKLSVSYPAEELHEPICYNYDDFDTKKIAWPFGFGLSYTTFEYSNIAVDKDVATNSERFEVSVDVENTGKVAAEEIVQLYLSPTSKNQNIRNLQLQGFSRVALKPQEKKTVKFSVATSQLGYFADNQWNVAPGKFMIKIGASSADIRQQAEVTLSGDKVTMPLRENYFAEVK